MRRGGPQGLQGAGRRPADGRLSTLLEAASPVRRRTATLTLDGTVTAVGDDGPMATDGYTIKRGSHLDTTRQATRDEKLRVAAMIRRRFPDAATRLELLSCLGLALDQPHRAGRDEAAATATASPRCRPAEDAASPTA